MRNDLKIYNVKNDHIQYRLFSKHNNYSEIKWILCINPAAGSFERSPVYNINQIEIHLIFDKFNNIEFDCHCNIFCLKVIKENTGIVYLSSLVNFILNLQSKPTFIPLVWVV